MAQVGPWQRSAPRLHGPHTQPPSSSQPPNDASKHALLCAQRMCLVSVVQQQRECPQGVCVCVGGGGYRPFPHSPALTSDTLHASPRHNHSVREANMRAGCGLPLRRRGVRAGRSLAWCWKPPWSAGERFCFETMPATRRSTAASPPPLPPSPVAASGPSSRGSLADHEDHAAHKLQFAEHAGWMASPYFQGASRSRHAGTVSRQLALPPPPPPPRASHVRAALAGCPI